ncbi:MAG: hypothetical protein IRZ16_05425 [Myxococcaceae bacterium]|nr:hypothetical protein [Myxococcaceae bacterium]
MVTWILTAVTLAAASGTGPVLSPAEQAQFKAYVLEGEKQFEAQEYGAAIWNFRAADALRVTPELAYNLAKAHEKIGDAPMAAYYYRLYLRRAPEAADALEVAEILGDILSKMEAEGRGLVELESSAPGEIVIDHHRFPQAPVAVFLPPGDFEVQMLGPDGAPRLTRKVSVITGRAVLEQLEPVPPPLLTAEGEPVAVSGLSGMSAARPSVRSVAHVSSWVLMGASVAALGVGTAFGALSRSEVARLEDRSALTVSQAQALARSAGSKGATANVLWLAGGAGLLAGGAVFAFTFPEPGMAREAHAGSAGAAR